MHHRELLVRVGLFLFGLLPMLPAQSASEPLQPSTLFTERPQRREAFRNAGVVAAVKAGLGWLLAHQDDDGRWDCDGFTKHDPAPVAGEGKGHAGQDVGVTALALLALLAQGDAAHKEPMRRAADYLASAQHSSSGYFMSDSSDYIYPHAIATIAMVEAAVVFDEPRYREVVVKALQALEAHRNPGAAWRYDAHQGTNDSSVTAWCVEAYTTAAHAGFEVKAESVGEALAWLESVIDPETGHCGYERRNEGSARTAAMVKSGRFPIDRTETLTAAALHARACAGFLLSGRRDRAAVDLVLAKPPLWGNGSIDFYYWHHGSEAMAVVPDRANGQKWAAAVQKALLSSPRKDGACAGSWDPKDPWGEIGGRIASTAFAVLALSSPYRIGASHGAAIAPAEAPFQSVHIAWRDGRPGAVQKALAAAVTSSVPADASVVRRIEWFSLVQASFCARVVAQIAAFHPDLLERHERLEELAAAYADTAGGKAAEAALAALLAKPANRDEIEAAQALRKIFAGFDANKPPKESGKRRQLREQFEKLVAKYPVGPSATKAREWIGYLK